MNPHVRAVTEFLKDKRILLGERPLGDNLMYRCPFHHGDSENFGIHESTGKWNCFKCKKRGRSAGDLLEALGINDSGITAAQVYNFVDVRFEVLRAFQTEHVIFQDERGLAKTFNLPVTCELNEAPAALEYVLKRGIDPSVIQACGAMYSPYGEYGRRIILPWYDGGELAGFSARSIDNNDYVRKMLRPKGSKQDLFLYNPTGKSLKRSRVFLTEGEFSSLALACMGYHACAIFGSYLHPGQINLLIEADEVVFVLDGDSAGRAETLRAAQRLRGFVPEIRICDLPEGKDPADIFLENPNQLRFFVERRQINLDILSQLKARL